MTDKGHNGADGIGSQPDGLAEAQLPHLRSLLPPVHVAWVPQSKPWDCPQEGESSSAQPHIGQAREKTEEADSPIS